jgi:DNA-binding NarL/FixJ family response regulator
MDQPTAETTVLVVEDDAMVRGWIRLSLEGTEFRLVGEATSANEATELLPRRLPELLLIDFRLGSSDELLKALRNTRDGKAAFDPRHPVRDPGRAALSPREREVLRLVAAGRTNRQIADDLAIGAETVKTLMTRTFAKLGVSRRAEAVATGQRMGLL